MSTFTPDSGGMTRDIATLPGRPAELPEEANGPRIHPETDELRPAYPVIIFGKIVTICGNSVISTSSSISRKK